MTTYKTPSQIAQQYLLTLKTAKPEVNTDQTDSDWWVRGQVVGGVFSGIYADQKKIADDAFPQSARREALQKHLFLYFDDDFTPATQSNGTVRVSGNVGSTIVIGTQFEYEPNGNIYAATESIVLSEATGTVAVKSIAAGQNQNLLEGTTLALPSPPPGVSPVAVVWGGDISDGRNVESNEQAAARILRQIREPLAGGKEADYEQFALRADPAVTSANVLRFPYGFGTVGVVIKAGTTDIDAALDKGEPIVVMPSQTLIDKVQAYIDTQNPLTDCATVLPPASVGVDVTVVVKYVSGDNDTVLSGQTLTQRQLVQREVQRAVYKTPPGGRRLGSSGYLVCSDIEETIDMALSSAPNVVGNKAAILLDRQVQDLSPSGANLALLSHQIPIPSVINVVEM